MFKQRNHIRLSRWVHESTTNSFDELEVEGLIVLPQDRYFDFFGVFDFEALLQPVSSQKHGPSTKVTHEHKPISVSIASNIITQGSQHSVLENSNICEQFKSPTCFVEESTDELLTKFIQHLSEMQKQSYTLTKQKYFLVFQRIETRMKTLQNLLKTYVTERQERENLNLEDAEVSEADEFDSSVMEVNVTEDSPDSEFEQGINVPNTYTRFLQKLCQEDRFEVEFNSFTSSPSQEDEESNENKEEDFLEKSIIDSYKEYDEYECKKALEGLEALNNKLETYCSQLPVLGFNSSKYDLNLVKQKLVVHLNLINEKDRFVVKKGNCYVCIANSKFKFLDITQFVAPGYSYEKFLRSYNASEGKGFFPYEYLTSIEKLDEPQLPHPDAFYSSLKTHNVLEASWLHFRSLTKKYNSEERALKEMGINKRPCTLEENYRYLQEMWQKHSMRSLRDLLIWYNNLDVGPFVEAVQCMLQFYKEQGTNLFKESISIP